MNESHAAQLVETLERMAASVNKLEAGVERIGDILESARPRALEVFAAPEVSETPQAPRPRRFAARGGVR